MQVRGRDQATVRACAQNVLRDLAHLGVQLEPLHAGTADPDLRSWFLVTVPSDGRPDDVVRQLQQHADVEAAYEKPAGEPP